MASPGWYGKLPMLGDFAHRRLPPGFVSACDDWLAQGVAASRAALGPAWLSHYLTAPLWCFAWSPRVVDEQWWFGVLMPSVDAVGRYFPLLVTFSAAQAPIAPGDLAQWAQWYERAGACALQTLQGQASLDAFEAALNAVGTPLIAPSADVDPRQQFADESQVHPAQHAATLALRSLTAGPEGRTVWWTQGGEEAAPTVTVVQGLPAADRFGALFQGAL